MSATACDYRLVLLSLTLAMYSATTHSAQESPIVPKQSAQQLWKQAGAIPGRVARGQLRVEDIPNPHWKADGCVACHTRTPSKQALHLRSNSSEKLCNTCHESISPHSYIHPVGMRPDKTMLRRMPRDFRKAIAKEKGRVSCRTCHDLTMTCRPKQAKKKRTNPKFFRGGPYAKRTDLCYLCHDASKYEHLNPHEQLTRSGKLKEDTCFICHEDGNKLKTATNIQQVDFNVKGDLSKMCTGCHPYQPHPGGSFSFSGKGHPNHLVMPNKSVQRRMQKMAKKNNIMLPLAPGSGEIFCGTCHNAHQKGVIKSAAAAQGADSKHRLRMQKMCANCHDK